MENKKEMIPYNSQHCLNTLKILFKKILIYEKTFLQNFECVSLLGAVFFGVGPLRSFFLKKNEGSTGKATKVISESSILFDFEVSNNYD
ncbi:hypothetical protein EGI26_19285 [Lacihabitans sp. CCS-44]|nr:hypothetical protein [Lacihabitans sp. CCS-44]